MAIVVATGCGGSVAHDAAPRALVPARPPAASPRPASALTTGGVTAPAADPQAAFIALERAAHELFAHPTPERLAELVVPRTRLHAHWEQRLRALVRAGRAERQPGSTVVGVDVVTVTDEVVYLLAAYRDTVQETLDTSGRVVAIEPMAPESRWVVVMRRDRTAGTARWWFVAIDRSVHDLEVVL